MTTLKFSVTGFTSGPSKVRQKIREAGPVSGIKLRLLDQQAEGLRDKNSEGDVNKIRGRDIQHASNMNLSSLSAFTVRYPVAE